MTQRRVVITGLGVVNALGIGPSAYLEALLDNRVGVSRIDSFNPEKFPSQVGGQCPELKMNKLVPKAHRKATKLMSRDIELVVVAADEAVKDAQLKTKGTAPDEPSDLDPMRSGVNIGAGLICCDLVELGAAADCALNGEGTFSLQKWGQEGMNALTPLWLLKYLPNMLNCHISIIHDLQGPNNSITCGEASGALSIGEAYRIIQHGKADVMIAGGAECKLNAMGLVRQHFMKRLCTEYNDRPTEACRPFDQNACGSVVAEGAGVVVLESLENAQQRGATIYGELTGFGASSNFSTDFITPEEDAQGVTIAIKKALQQANVSPDQLDLIVPHGAAVPEHDRAEARGIHAALGDAAAQVPVVATKSRLGNCGAGSSAVDFVTAALALKHGKLFKTMNCPDPVAQDGLNIINDGPQDADLARVLVSTYTYGGQTAALVIQRYEP